MKISLKDIVLIGIAFLCIFVAMKRKEPEKEVEEEIVLKKSKTIVYQAPKLMEQTGKKIIDNFLLTKNKIERDLLRADYEKILNPEMKEYIQSVVNMPNCVGETLLHNAKNHWQVEQLLFLGAKTDFESKLNQYPLTTMLMKGNNKAAETFMNIAKHTGQIVYIDFAGYTALHYALICNAVMIVKNILSNPANLLSLRLNKRVGNLPGVTPLILAVRYCPEAIPLLLENGANINRRDHFQSSPLLYASGTQPKSIIKLMIKQGATQDVTDNTGENMLFIAARNNNDKLINYLVKKKILEIDSENMSDETPLAVSISQLSFDVANYGRHRETIKKLIELGASINKSFMRGKGFLSFILKNFSNDIELIEYFVKHGADVNYVNSSAEKGYPLVFAIFENYKSGDEIYKIREHLNFKLINFLIENGAKIMLKDLNIILESKDHELIIALSKANLF